MPKTRTDDAIHIVITDHRIQRRPGANLTAAKAETREQYRGPVVPYYPAKVEPLYEAVAQVRDGANVEAGLPLLASLSRSSRRWMRDSWSISARRIVRPAMCPARPGL